MSAFRRPGGAAHATMSGLNGGRTIELVMPAGPSWAKPAVTRVGNQQSERAIPMALVFAIADCTESNIENDNRGPNISIDRYRKSQTRQGAGLARQIIDLGAKIPGHCLDEPGPQSSTLSGSAEVAANAVVLHQQLAPTICQTFEIHANFATPLRIGILESIGHPLRHDYAEINAGIGPQLDGLEMVIERGAMPLVLHRALKIFQQVQQIFVERNQPHIPRAVQPFVHVRDRVNAGFSLGESVLCLLVVQRI